MEEFCRLRNHLALTWVTFGQQRLEESIKPLEKIARESATDETNRLKVETGASAVGIISTIAVIGVTVASGPVGLFGTVVAVPIIAGLTQAGITIHRFFNGSTKKTSQSILDDDKRLREQLLSDVAQELATQAGSAEVPADTVGEYAELAANGLIMPGCRAALIGVRFAETTVAGVNITGKAVGRVFIGASGLGLIVDAYTLASSLVKLGKDKKGELHDGTCKVIETLKADTKGIEGQLDQMLQVQFMQAMISTIGRDDFDHLIPENLDFADSANQVNQTTPITAAKIQKRS